MKKTLVMAMLAMVVMTGCGKKEQAVETDIVKAVVETATEVETVEVVETEETKEAETVEVETETAEIETETVVEDENWNGSGSDATGEELTDAEKAAVEQAEIEAQKQAEAQRQAEEAAKAQAEAQRQAEEAAKAQTPVQENVQVQNWENPDGSTNYDAMRAAGYSEEQIEWQRYVDETADRSNPNYGKTTGDTIHVDF